MINFPNIKPEIFTIEILGMDLSLRWYAVSYIAGFAVALYIMKIFLNKPNVWKEDMPPIDKDEADSFLTYLILGVIVGGRLGYVLFYNLGYYLAYPQKILSVWDGGMSFHGGFIGVVIAVILYARVNSVPLWSLSDLIALASPPGLFFGRIANFINAELWGRPTDMPWGVVFPGEFAQNCVNVEGLCSRHPSQLYEAILEGFCLFLILFVFARNGAFKKSGLITAVFFLGYGFSRYFVEFYRVPDPQFLSDVNPLGYAYSVFGIGFTMGQVLSVPMVIVGIILLARVVMQQKFASYLPK